jgi:hypothetical protein
LSRKKHDLLTTGLSSELFLLAFLEPDNARRLGQRLQNTTKTPSNYSKIHPAIHDLTIAKYLKFKDEDRKYYPNLDKLIEEIDMILKGKNESLIDDEKKSLKQFLKGREFFKIISMDIEKKIQDQPKGKHQVNALEFFCDKIGYTVGGLLLLKQNSPKFQNLPKLTSEGKKELEKLDQLFMNEKFGKMIEKKFTFDDPRSEIMKMIIENMFKTLVPLMNFAYESETLLKKLTKLWDGFENMFLGFEMRKESEKYDKT